MLVILLLQGAIQLHKRSSRRIGADANADASTSTRTSTSTSQRAVAAGPGAAVAARGGSGSSDCCCSRGVIAHHTLCTSASTSGSPIASTTTGSCGGGSGRCILLARQGDGPAPLISRRRVQQHGLQQLIKAPPGHKLFVEVLVARRVHARAQRCSELAAGDQQLPGEHAFDEGIHSRPFPRCKLAFQPRARLWKRTVWSHGSCCRSSQVGW